MYHVSMKKLTHSMHMPNWTHSMHMPSRHGMAVGADHLFHDDRFWALVGAVVLFAVLIGLAIIANRTGTVAPDFSPTNTFFPY